MYTRIIRRLAPISLISCAVLLAACDPGVRQNTHVSVDPQARISANMYPALRGTIGEFSAFIDSNPIPVEGYGVIAGLPNSGSGEMDPKIRELLIDRLVTAGVGLYSTDTQNISPEEIMASNQVAAVEVRGVIPPLALKGTTFDLYINAVPNSRTTSLANGLLWTSELKVIGLNLDGNDSRTLALGRGPVFIPGSLDAAAKGGTIAATTAPADGPSPLRAGRVLGGGVCMDSRPARLHVYSPSYRVTAAIERTINARFPGRNKAATAEDDLVVSLHVPPDFHDAPADFVELVRHLYLGGDEAGYNEQRVHDIIEALKTANAPHEDLGLALQGIGRLDLIQPYYTSSFPAVRFWCARAGACLHDAQGMGILQEFFQDPASPFRRQALMGIIASSRGLETERATMALMEMLGSANTDDRILAYHGLLAIRSRAVVTYSVGRKFLIDVVPADSPPLIYVLEADSPRIAFIGRPLTLSPGALYISQDRMLTVSADMPVDADAGGSGAVVTAASLGDGPAPAASQPAEKLKETVTLYWRPPLNDRDPVKLRSMPGIPAVVARATWIPDPMDREHFDAKAPYIGATYQRITEMLANMCTDKMLDAKFVVQHAPEMIISPTDLATGGRPEGSTRVTPPPPPPPPPNPDPASMPEAGGSGSAAPGGAAPVKNK